MAGGGIPMPQVMSPSYALMTLAASAHQTSDPSNFRTTAPAPTGLERFALMVPHQPPSVVGGGGLSVPLAASPAGAATLASFRPTRAPHWPSTHPAAPYTNPLYDSPPGQHSPTAQQSPHDESGGGVTGGGATNAGAGLSVGAGSSKVKQFEIRVDMVASSLLSLFTSWATGSPLTPVDMPRTSELEVLTSVFLKS